MKFSRRAQQQMVRRRTAAVEVAEALENRETSYAGRPNTRTVIHGRTSAGRRLKVIIADDIVVTVASRDEDG